MRRGWTLFVVLLFIPAMALAQQPAENGSGTSSANQASSAGGAAADLGTSTGTGIGASLGNVIGAVSSSAGATIDQVMALGRQKLELQSRFLELQKEARPAEDGGEGTAKGLQPLEGIDQQLSSVDNRLTALMAGVGGAAGAGPSAASSRS